MKKMILLALGVLAFAGKAFSQYYFQDIYNTRQTIATMALLKANKVKTQDVQTLDANMEIDRDFRCERTLSPTYHQMKSQTQSSSTGYSALVSFFSSKGLLTKTVDSSGASITTTLYRYDNGDRLQYISSKSAARDSKMRFEETRSYSYDTAGRLQQMVNAPIAGLDLSRGLSGPLTCANGRAQAALASQSGMERLTLSFDGKGAYRAQFAINVDRDPAMAAALAVLGFKPGSNGYVLTTTGRF